MFCSRNYAPLPPALQARTPLHTLLPPLSAFSPPSARGDAAAGDKGPPPSPPSFHFPLPSHRLFLVPKKLFHSMETCFTSPGNRFPLYGNMFHNASFLAPSLPIRVLPALVPSGASPPHLAPPLPVSVSPDARLSLRSSHPPFSCASFHSIPTECAPSRMPAGLEKLRHRYPRRPVESIADDFIHPDFRHSPL